MKEEGDNKLKTLKIGPFTEQSLLCYTHLLNRLLVLAGTDGKQYRKSL